MSQAKLLKNMEKYLILVNEQGNKKFAAAVGAAGGVCFSLSLIRAVMRKKLKKGKYWDHLLVAANNWDGEPESLNDEVQLPETNDGKPVKLGDIFERLINFVLPNQANEALLPQEFHLGHDVQRDFLIPKEKQFQVLVQDDKGAKVRNIAKQNRYGGSFTPAQLALLVSNNTLIKDIVIFGNQGHAIEGSYENGEYVVYNPNYQHKSIDSMVRKFKNKNDFFAEIQRVLGAAINIEVATLDRNASVDITDYEKFVMANSVSVLMNGGWREIYDTQGKLLPDIITKAVATHGGAAAILNEIAHDQVGALSLFAFIRLDAAGCLGRLFEVAAQSKTHMVMLAQRITAQDHLGEVELYRLVGTDKTRKFVQRFIIAACEFTESRNAIASTCDLKDDEGNTGFFHILQGCKDAFGAYLHAILFSPKAVDRLLNAFNAEDCEEERIGLVYAARTKPEYLAKIFDVILQSEAGLKRLANIIFKERKQGYIAADVIDEIDSKKCKKEIIAAFTKNFHRYDLSALKDFIKQLEKIVPEKNQKGSYSKKLRMFGVTGSEPNMWVKLLVAAKNEMASRLVKPIKKPVEEQCSHSPRK